MFMEGKVKIEKSLVLESTFRVFLFVVVFLCFLNFFLAFFFAFQIR